MATFLRNEVIKLSAYRETARVVVGDALSKAVTMGDASKLVILDPSFTKPFDLLGISAELLSEDNNVVDTYELVSEVANRVPETKARNLVFLVRPAPESLMLAKTLVNNYRAQSPEAAFFIYIAPKTGVAEHTLSKELKLESSQGPKSTIVISDIQLTLLPIDDDLLSMELRTDFRDLYVNGDVTLLYHVARSIIDMQMAYTGPIPMIKGKGKHGAKVVRIVERLQNEVGLEQLNENPAEVMGLYVIDRSVDIASLMMTQLTYEGFIDDLYSITASQFSPPFEVSSGEGQQQQNHHAGKPIPLTNADPIFAELRDRNFTTVGGVLKAKSLEIKQLYDRRKEVQQLKELKEFMKALPETQERHRLIGVHTNIATEIGKTVTSPIFREWVAMEQSIVRQEDDKRIFDFIEDAVNRCEDVRRVVRLLVLFSVVNNGIKPKYYDVIKDSLFLAYGIPQMMALLYMLDRSGLLVRQDMRSSWGVTKKDCKIWFEGLNEKNPNDASYAYSGYCPLLVRAIEQMTSGTVGSEVPASGGGGGGGAGADPTPGETVMIKKDSEVTGTKKIVIIYIVGGITHGELSALRHVQTRLSDRTGENVHFVFCATSVKSGPAIMDTITPFEVVPQSQ